MNINICRALLFAIAISCGCGSVVAQDKKPLNIALGLNHRTADSLLFSNFNIGLFDNVDTLYGFQIGALTSVVRKEMRGVNIGGLSSISRGKAYGLTLGGIINAVDGDMRGLQMAGVANITTSANGVQIAGLTNACTTPFRGIQISGITNISMGVKRGIQLAGAANVCSSYMRGIQIASYNYADTLNGSQLGIINVCVSHPRGVQVGIINYSRDTVAHKIGLVNVNPNTKTDLMFYAGSATKINVAVRFRNRSTYNIIGVGTHYMGLDEKFSGAVFYRIGQYFMLSPRWSVSGDIGFAHVETFSEDSGDKPDRLYSLQARINLDCKVGKLLGAFLTVGYGDTRHYYHSQRYRARAIVEGGITLNYNKNK